MKKPKKTLFEKMEARKMKRPPALLYYPLLWIWKLMMQKRLNFTYTYNIDMKKVKPPFILISNHASRVDYLYTGLPFKKHRMNYVVGYNEFFRKHLKTVFRLLQVIPKRNFVTDLHTVKEVNRILKKKGAICFMPEGMSSIQGDNQPAALGTGKLLKYCNVPVYYTKIFGGYMTNTKYNLDERPGKVEVVVDIAFTPAQLQSMTPDEIQDRVNELIRECDYDWNKMMRVKFDGHGEMAKDIHYLLYRCPKCHTEFSMKSEGDIIKCTKCGNGAMLNAYYDLVPFDETCVIPESPVAWCKEEREFAKSQLKEEGFVFRDKCKLAMLDPYKYVPKEIGAFTVGEGEIEISMKGFYYRGTRDGKPFEVYLSPENLPTTGMITDTSFFCAYYNMEYMEFHTEKSSIKFLHLIENVHRMNGGKWKEHIYK